MFEQYIPSIIVRAWRVLDSSVLILDLYKGSIFVYLSIYLLDASLLVVNGLYFYKSEMTPQRKTKNSKYRYF